VIEIKFPPKEACECEHWHVRYRTRQV